MLFNAYLILLKTLNQHVIKKTVDKRLIIVQINKLITGAIV